MDVSIELDAILFAVACILFGRKCFVEVAAIGKLILVFLRAGIAIPSGILCCQNIFPVPTCRFDDGLDVILGGLIFLPRTRQLNLLHLHHGGFAGCCASGVHCRFLAG
jgi:hypothetical protein